VLPQYVQALTCFERSGDKDYIERTKAALAIKEAEALRTTSQFREAALKYEEAYRLSYRPQDVDRSAQYGRNAAWCYEQVKRPDAWESAGNLYRELGDYEVGEKTVIY